MASFGYSRLSYSKAYDRIQDWMRRSSYCQVYLEQFSDFHRNADNEQFHVHGGSGLDRRLQDLLPDAEYYHT